MKITFIFHSSFVAELKQSILIFDYYGEGVLPDFPEGKQIFFLNSHGHHDHFNREILKLRDRYPNAEYILSRDIRFHKDEQRPWIHSVRADMEYDFGALHIRTLRSTDLGVAFVVETEGRRIYHAGDLNWWHWEGEEKTRNNNMAANYKKIIDQLEGVHLDAAFVPLDPRLGDAYDWGMKYFLEKTCADAVFPMHLWEQYEVSQKVLNWENYRSVDAPGQVWNLRS
jgi:L-ascorbate metabolism protein UlaG (beta-lactamase superfamily)